MDDKIEIVPYKISFKDSLEPILNKLKHNYNLNEKTITINNNKTPSIHLALIKGSFVGLYKIWVNRFHPKSLYFTISVFPRYRKLGVGKALYEQILSLNSKHKYLHASIWSSNDSGRGFLEHLGFRLYRKTFEPSLELSYISQSEINQRTRVSENYRIKTVSEIKNTKNYPELIKLSRECYRISHLDNPMADISIKEWQEIFESDLLEEGSFVLEDDGKIIAFTNMHKTSESVAELGWRGVDFDYKDESSSIILALTYKQIEFAKKAQFKNITAEIDSTDKLAFELFNNLPFKSKEVIWLSYQKELS